MNAANLARLEAVFRRVMKVDDCRPEFAMRTLVQWDSLKHVELLTEIDEEFDVQIEPTHLWKMTSVAGIIEVLSEHVD